MGRDLERGIKRFLKRRVKITLGFIVAFLLSCSFVMGEGLYIQNNDDTNEIEFSQDNSTWGENPYKENKFKKNVYTINGELKTDEVSLVNWANGISLINNGGIIVESTGIAWGIDNVGIIGKIENNGILSIMAVNNATGIYNSGTIEKFANNGVMEVESQSGDAWGISNNGEIGQIENNNFIKVIGKERATGIGSYNTSSLERIINNGNIIVESDKWAQGIKKLGEMTEIIENNGTIEVFGGMESIGIDIEKENRKLINNGKIFIESNLFGAGIRIYNGVLNSILNNGLINIFIDTPTQIQDTKLLRGMDIRVSNSLEEGIEIFNKGVINAITSQEIEATALRYVGDIKKSIIENRGKLFAKSNSKAMGIDVTSEDLQELKNFGVISVVGKNDLTSTIYMPSEKGEIKNLENDGIMASNKKVIYRPEEIANITNNGLFVGELEQSLKDKIQDFNKGFAFKVENGKYTDINRAESSADIINASLIDNGEKGTESITFENKKETGKIYNGITDTLSVKGKNSLVNSAVNGYTNAVVFDNAGGELALNNTIINGGIAENSFAVKGQSGSDILSLSNETIINGNVNLNGGNDSLSLDSTVQINGILDGGAGDGDILTFNSSVTKSSSDKNINILYDIKGFEKTDIDTNVTLFEKTVNDNGDIKNLVAGLGNITIQNNGKLTLRVDGTEKDGDKIIGHALYRNDGSLQTEETGKLVLGLYGVGNEAVVAFGGTKIENLNSDNVETSSYLHSVKVNGSENVIEVSAKKDLEDLDIANYDKLNKIYHSILSSENTDKFTVGEEQKGAFFKYLHDFYAGSPYAYSSELSRKTMGMMRNLADRDLHPELNKWSIYGGLSHIDGGTKESFYGRNYYGYDVGSRDIETDTKITGGYFKAEYGKSENLTTGIIFGGNNAESEIGNSKVEGDSFYFGGYAKKFVNDFRFTLGAGFQHGDYKADRTAVGYEGITTTRSYSENYHDRGFDIYGDIRYSKEIGDNLFFEPGFTLSYTYLDQDGATENGTLAIETDSKNFDYLSSEINLDVRKTILADKLTHSFIAGISYERLLNGYDEEYITGRVIGGTDFDILIPAKEKDNFLLNAKYELETEKGMLFDLKCSYRFEHDNNQDEWTVGAGAGYKF